MKFKSYISVGSINFSDSLGEVKAKMPTGVEGVKSFLDDNHKCLYFSENQMLVVFSKDAKSVYYIEIWKGTIDYQGKNLLDMPFNLLMGSVTEKDKTLDSEEGWFSSGKLGFGAGAYLSDGEFTEKVESIIMFSREYSETPALSTDDIINHYFPERGSTIKQKIKKWFGMK